MKKQNIGFQTEETLRYGDYVSKYDVIWDSPSSCSRDSMPIGDGENGLNVWAEAENGIFILIGRADTPFHVKSGRLHITTEPDVFSGEFRMETQLYDGCLRITAGGCMFDISVDAASDPLGAIHILVNSPNEIKLTASFELWRDYALLQTPSALSELEKADCLLDFADGAAWLSHSAKEGCRGELCVGGELFGDGFAKITPSEMEKSFSGNALITAFMFADDCSDTGEWYEKLRGAELAYKSVGFTQRLEAHKRWWHSFWSRSYIELSNTSDSFSITQRYVLQRYIFACSSRGLLPSLYNGSIFRTELEKGADRAFGWIAEQKTTADERPWGSDYMGQNMRQQFWGLLASGDFDLFEPLIRLIRGYLPYGRREAWETMGHGGFFIPEKFTDHGFTYSESDIDAFSEDKRLCRPEENWEKRFWHLQYHFIPTIEFTSMFVQLYLYTQNERLLTEVVVPCVSECLRFYREHYSEKDANGKMKIYPAATAETYGKARSGYHDFKQREDVLNPATEVSGLRYIVASCQKISGKLPAELLCLLNEYTAILPELPCKSYDGIYLLAPGESYSPGLTCEAAELYPVFPFRNIDLASSYADRALAVRSYFLRRTSLDGSSDVQYWETGGWHPAGLDAAMLGLSYEASRIMEINYSDSLPVISMINNSPYENRPDRPRFPGFWNYPHMDGIPDQCHGGVSLNLLETMLLSWDDAGKIYLLPAWRGDRDVSFSLRAPLDTTVECVFMGGRVVSLKVTPDSRAKDIVDCTGIAAQIKRLVEFKAASVNEYFGLSPMTDGTLSADDTIYRPILKPFILKYGEALCKTRPWLLQNDFVHTFYADNRLYAVIFEGDTDNTVTIECPQPLAAHNIGAGELSYAYADGRLTIDRKNCVFENGAAILRFDLSDIVRIGQNEGIAYSVVQISSAYGVGKAANIAPHTEFFWQPSPDDEQPSVIIGFDAPKDMRRVELKLMLPYEGYGIRHDFTINKICGGEKSVAVESAVFGRFWGQPVRIDGAEKLMLEFERASEFGISEIRIF